MLRRPKHSNIEGVAPKEEDSQLQISDISFSQHTKLSLCPTHCQQKCSFSNICHSANELWEFVIMPLQVIKCFCHLCSLHLSPLNTLIIFCVQYKSKKLSHNFFHPPVTFSLSGPNTLLSPFSQTPAGCSSLSHYVKDQMMNCRINK